MRVNNELIEMKLDELDRKNKSFTLQNSKLIIYLDTIISIWSLLIGLIYTSKIDLLWHLIYLLGYLYQRYNFYIEGGTNHI